MLGSLITRPIRFATRVTSWGAHQALDIAGGVVGLVLARIAGDGHEDGTSAARSQDRPSAEPAAWRGPGASSTSAPADTGSTPVAGPGRTPTRRSTRPVRVNGAGEVQTGQTREAGGAGEAQTSGAGEAQTGDAGSRPQRRSQTNRARRGSQARTRPGGTGTRRGTTRRSPGEEAPREAEPIRRDPEADAERVIEAHEREQAQPTVPDPVVPEPGHVSEEPQLVEEFADAGAEAGAGAQIRVDEPWDGYREMKAADVIARLPAASTEELAAIELYELSGRKRKSVLAAVQRSLKQASPPRAS